MTEKNPYLHELGQFLRARRGELSPEELGLPATHDAQRRVAGLRRQEVADGVAISQDYYARIEQGRLAPSEPVLEAIAHFLRLKPDQRDYLEGLAQRAERRTPPRPRPKLVRPQLQRLLDQLTDTPAIIVGKYLDIVAWNPLASALMVDLGRMTAHERNYVRMVFTDQRVRDLYYDWEAMARSSVATLRLQAADNPHDPRLAALVGELSLVSPHFRQWWADHRVARPDFGSKTIRHPELGDLTLDWDAFSYVGDPDQQLVMWSADQNSTSHDKLRILASWSARPAERGSDRKETRA
ncbi:helix-turn-helix transcriptional regulator [Streptomyces pseudovenezuelae]|uniref:helix-turn-helix domain-containing protein n=1 Tax=Streptomyces pseudovenezuelae TaxID=67350 RepID=UPI003246CBB0